jgi:microcystin-dependent protein
MTLYKWSQTASADATADATINWAEGQAPSSVNDSARAMMAATAKYRDDIAGAIVTSGSSVSYSVSSYQVFDTLAHLDGQMIAFTPHATNSGNQAFLNVDSLGVKTLRSAPGIDLQPGTLIQGTPYVAVYNNNDGVFYLRGFYGNPYNVPVGAGMDFWGGTAPNSSFAFPFGQAISRTTYATLFSMISTTFGAGDGSTTFNLPDKRGRVSACPDIMGGPDAGRLAAGALASVRNSFGGAGGESGHTLTINEMPSHNHSAADSGHNHPYDVNQQGTAQGGGSPLYVGNPTSPVTTGIGFAQVTIGYTGSGVAHNVMQPTILCNYIMRIL